MSNRTLETSSSDKDTCISQSISKKVLRDMRIDSFKIIHHIHIYTHTYIKYMICVDFAKLRYFYHKWLPQHCYLFSLQLFPIAILCVRWLWSSHRMYLRGLLSLPCCQVITSSYIVVSIDSFQEYSHHALSHVALGATSKEAQGQRSLYHILYRHPIVSGNKSAWLLEQTKKAFFFIFMDPGAWLL